MMRATFGFGAKKTRGPVGPLAPTPPGRFARVDDPPARFQTLADNLRHLLLLRAARQGGSAGSAQASLVARLPPKR